MWKLVAIIMSFNAEGYSSIQNETGIEFEQQRKCELRASNSVVFMDKNKAAFLMCVTESE